MNKSFITIALLIIVTTLAGCATTPPPVPDIVWPLPPDEPRIKYLGFYRSKLEFAKTGGEKFKELLFGQEKVNLLVQKPYGVATDSKGRIFIADSFWRGVLVVDSQERRIDLWGQEGQVKLALPLGLALDSQDNLYVSDAALKRIVVFDTKGKLISQIGTKDELTNPAGIAVDNPRQRLIVADSKANKVRIFDLKGTLIIDLEAPASSEGGKFHSPTNVAVDKEGNIYVVDTLNHRIQIFDRDGKFIRTFGRIGTGFGDFVRPKGIAIDSEGHIYVVDAAFENFQIFDQQGQLLLFVGTGGGRPGEFSSPAGIWIDKNDKIYVTDQTYNPRVQIFQYLKK